MEFKGCSVMGNASRPMSARTHKGCRVHAPSMLSIAVNDRHVPAEAFNEIEYYSKRKRSSMIMTNSLYVAHFCKMKKKVAEAIDVSQP